MNMKKIFVIMMFVVLPIMCKGFSIDDLKALNDISYKAIPLIVDSMIVNSKSVEVMGGYEFFEVDGGYYILQGITTKDYIRFSNTYFKEINKKPYYKWKVGKIVCDWEIDLSPCLKVRSYFIEELGVLCININEKPKYPFRVFQFWRIHPSDKNVAYSNTGEMITNYTQQDIENAEYELLAIRARLESIKTRMAIRSIRLGIY